MASFGNDSDQSSFSLAPVPDTSEIVQGMLTMPLAPSNSMIPVLAVGCLVAARNSLMDVEPRVPSTRWRRTLRRVPQNE
ncbi:hypothetical protein [Bradyrhizobium sp. LCT2]|uniref:hypothetical protein n=1 Tax=Bradyrhizobium sp. LCT2 TaxID=2493093 RepID=UPI001FEEDE7C|nr:hypothetical protein [Bradyrhizobium sp. LCT2]